MKKIKMLVGLGVAALSAAFFCPPQVIAQTVDGGPEGSYTETCKNIKTIDNIKITATCQMESSSGIFGFGGIATKETSLDYIFTCKKKGEEHGDIANIDGTLCCARSLETAEVMKARKAFDRVTAQFGGGVTYFAKSQGDPDAEIQYWMVEYYRREPAIKKQIPSLMYDQIVSIVVRNYIKENPDIQTEIVNQAYQAVYKCGPTPDEMGRWVPLIGDGKKFYDSIVADLKIEKLKTNRTCP